MLKGCKKAYQASRARLELEQVGKKGSSTRYFDGDAELLHAILQKLSINVDETVETFHYPAPGSPAALLIVGHVLGIVDPP